MPLPKPKKGEEKQEFISRCISTLIEEDKDKFPTRAQRAAVCYNQWGETPAEKAAYEKRKDKQKDKKS